MKKVMAAIPLWLVAVSAALGQTLPVKNLSVSGTITVSGSTAHGLTVGQGSSAFTWTAPGTAGQPLLSGGASADPTYGTLGVSGGGLGLTSIPQYNVLLGNGTGAVSTAAPSATAGLPLVSNGSAANPSFQALTNLGQVTAYNGISTIANGIPSEYAQINLTAQTASVASATLYAVPSSGAGFYLAIVDTICTTAGTAGTVSATIGWNNGSAAATAASGAMSLSTLGNETTQIFTVYSAASQNITYSTTVTGAAGSPQYSVRIRLVYLG